MKNTTDILEHSSTFQKKLDAGSDQYLGSQDPH